MLYTNSNRGIVRELAKVIYTVGGAIYNEESAAAAWLSLKYQFNQSPLVEWKPFPYARQCGQARRGAILKELSCP